MMFNHPDTSSLIKAVTTQITTFTIIKERVHSEMKISQIQKGILVIVPIRFLSFRLFYLSGRKGYGEIMQVRKL